MSKSTTTVRYEVRYGSAGTIMRTGYSQYWKRFKLKEQKKLRGPVHGLAQARAHVAELWKFRHEGKLIHKDRCSQSLR